MDDIQIILYIIFVVVAILVRAFKSKDKQPSKQAQPTEDDSSQESQPSFEDLLKEFTGEKDEVQEHREWQQSPVDEEYEGDDDEAQRVYEESVRKARDLKTQELYTEGDSNRHTGSFHHFKGYEEDEDDVPNEFIEMLQDAEGAKKAIILSEIINRKY